MGRIRGRPVQERKKRERVGWAGLGGEEKQGAGGREGEGHAGLGIVGRSWADQRLGFLSAGSTFSCLLSCSNASF